MFKSKLRKLGLAQFRGRWNPYRPVRCDARGHKTSAAATAVRGACCGHRLRTGVSGRGDEQGVGLHQVAQPQNPENRREILADDKLRKVFGKDKVTMFEMTKHLNQHLK